MFGKVGKVLSNSKTMNYQNEESENKQKKKISFIGLLLLKVCGVVWCGVVWCGVVWWDQSFQCLMSLLVILLAM